MLIVRDWFERNEMRCALDRPHRDDIAPSCACLRRPAPSATPRWLLLALFHNHHAFRLANGAWNECCDQHEVVQSMDVYPVVHREQTVYSCRNASLWRRKLIYLFIYSYGMEPVGYGLYLERDETTKARRVDKGEKTKDK
jgi:hypothetical protein